MNRCKVALLVCVVALAAVFGLSGCSSLPFSQTYTPTSKSPEVSSPTIGKDGVLRVGVDTSNPPMAGQSNSIIGIDVDIAAALADELGLKLEVVDVKGNYADALAKGTVDLALGVDSSSVTGDVWASDAYMSTAIALFAANSTAKIPSTSDSVKIAAQISSLSAWRVTNEFGSNTLVTETDLASAFKDLGAGKVDYVAADAIVGTYSAHSAGIDSYIAGLLQTPGGYVAVVAKGNTSLQTAVSSKLKTLESNGMIALIQKKWLGTSLKLDGMTLSAGANNPNAASGTEGSGGTSTALEQGNIASNAIQQ